MNMPNLIVSELLINDVTVYNLKLERVKLVLNWAIYNPDKIDLLTKLLHQLDCKGIKTFGHSISYCHKQNGSDPIACAKRVLRYQKLRVGINKLYCAIKANGKKELILSNGVKCMVTCDKRGDYWISLLNCGTRVRLRMWIGQVVFIENIASKHIKMLKRIKPAEIRYYKEGKWHSVPYPRHYAAMTAISETAPLEIGVLLAE
jgi:hypothetical protein